MNLNYMHQQSSTYIKILYNHYCTIDPALGPMSSQETQAAKEDLEDFVQWRRPQPVNAKAMVSAECEAPVLVSSLHGFITEVIIYINHFGGDQTIQIYGKFEEFPLL